MRATSRRKSANEGDPPVGRDRAEGEGEMMRRTVLIALALLVSPAAQAYYVTYQQWQAMPELARNAYIIGAFDGYLYESSQLISPAREQAAAFHYEMCLSKAKMTNGQLAANVLNFASDKPKLHTGPVQQALFEYLFSACGAAPTK
jgi:hypothetical protein